MKKYGTLVELLRSAALKKDDQQGYTFLVDREKGSNCMSYKELDIQARVIAAYLQELKTSGDRALLLYSPGLEFIAAFFGCIYANVIAVPVYPPQSHQSLSSLQGVLEDSQSSMVLTTKNLASKLQVLLDNNSETSKLQWICTDDLTDDLASNWKELAINADTLAFLQYTSGSTGRRKGVMVSHGNLLHNLELIYCCFQHTSNSKGVIWLPPYHDMGLIGGVLQPLYGRFPVTLMSPTSFLKKPFRWLKAISDSKATTSGGPSFAYDLCVKKIKPEEIETLDLSTWELAFNGAEPVRAETIEEFSTTFAPCGFRREAFYPCYGMAETTLFVSGGAKTSPPVIYPVKGAALEQNLVVSANSQEDTRLIVGCGNQWLDQKVVIVDPESLIQCSIGKVGEIWVSGSSVAQGYWNQSDQTTHTFRNYLADTLEEPFLRTGDLGFLKDGELFVTGRLKDLIIIRGRNHYPQDIEATVQGSHPALRKGGGAAFTVDIKTVEKLVVVQEIKRHDLHQTDLSRVIGDIRQAIAAQHALQAYAVILVKNGGVPKTSSGKIQRFACRKSFLDGTLAILEVRDINSS